MIQSMEVLLMTKKWMQDMHVQAHAWLLCLQHKDDVLEGKAPLALSTSPVCLFKNS